MLGFETMSERRDEVIQRRDLPGLAPAVVAVTDQVKEDIVAAEVTPTVVAEIAKTGERSTAWYKDWRYIAGGVGAVAFAASTVVYLINRKKVK